MNIKRFGALFRLITGTLMGIFVAPLVIAQGPSTIAATLDLVQIKTMYTKGQYGQLADLLTPYLKQNPSDSKARAVLVLALLKLDENDLARTELKTLKANTSDFHAMEYAKHLGSLFQTITQDKQKKEEMYSALIRYDAARASALLRDLSIDVLHKGILQIYIDVYQGDFDEAKKQLAALSPVTLSDSRTIRQLAQQIEGERSEAQRLRTEIEDYLYSEVTANVCNSILMTQSSRYPKGGPFVTAADFQRYIENVMKLNALTPLNSDVMDLVFHVTMLGADYKDVELVGDRIIQGKGNIRIPFLSSESYFYLNIDARRRQISTEPNPNRKLVVAVDYPALLPTDYSPLVLFHAAKVAHHAPQARWYEKEEAFALSLDEVERIDQHAKDWRGGLQSKAYALKLSPKGLAPNYLLMNVLACVFGEEAQRKATRNLGLFVQHVAAPHEIQATLVDPSKHTVDIWGEGQFGSMITAMYSSTATKYGSWTDIALSSLMSEQMAKQEASKQNYDQNQSNFNSKWFMEIRAISDGFQENKNMIEVEKLLQLE